jgi:hypothetical protein
MKATISILALKEWKVEDKQGVSAYFLLENEYNKLLTTSLSPEVQKVVELQKLPAVFEVDVSVTMATFGGKSSLKHTLHSAKFIKESKVF